MSSLKQTPDRYIIFTLLLLVFGPRNLMTVQADQVPPPAPQQTPSPFAGTQSAPNPPRFPQAMTSFGQNANTEAALEAYAALTHKTVLRGATLPDLKEPIIAQIPADTNAAIAFVEAALAGSGLEILPKEEAFALVVPSGFRESKPAKWVESIQVHALPQDDVLPAGMLDFRSVDLPQALQVYSELASHTVLRPARLYSAPISLRTQNALKKSQVIYALDVVFALNGVAMVRDGEKFIQAVPLIQASEVKANAPKPEKEDRLIEPKRVPAFDMGLGRPSPPRPLQTNDWLSAISEQYDAVRARLGLGPPLPPTPTTGNLASLYARLCGKKLVPAKLFDDRWIIFVARTPLTKAELLYGIEKTFELNSLAILPVDGESIQIGPISQARKTMGGAPP